MVFVYCTVIITTIVYECEFRYVCIDFDACMCGSIGR